MYEHGIFDGCSPDAIINHAVVAVGYGQDQAGVKFWHIQNSWGKHWGGEEAFALDQHAELRIPGLHRAGLRPALDVRPEALALREEELRRVVHCQLRSLPIGAGEAQPS